MAQQYSNPGRASDPHALPNIETFEAHYATCANCEAHVTGIGSRWARCPECQDQDVFLADSGWYWQACFPRCLPDGEPTGPFATEAEAVADAHANASDDDDDTTE